MSGGDSTIFRCLDACYILIRMFTFAKILNQFRSIRWFFLTFCPPPPTHKDWRDDLKACTEVMNSCQNLQITMPDDTMQKLVVLVLKKDKKLPNNVNKTKRSKRAASRLELEF